MNIYQWKSFISQFNEDFEKVKPGKEWEDNTTTNLSRIHKSNSIWKLVNCCSDSEGKEKAVIIVGASPSLKRDITKFQNLDDHFLVISANSALKYLLEYGVKPDFTICLDSDSVDISEHLDCDNADLDLIASNIVSPSVLDKWKGKIWFMPHYAVGKELNKKLRNRLGSSVPCGGNAVTKALSIALSIFKARMFVFVGNEFCVDKSYYVDKGIKRSNPNPSKLPIKDVEGNQRFTHGALYTYAIWLEQFCRYFSPVCTFVDSSLGILGADRNSVIKYREFSNIIANIKAAFKKRDYLNRNQGKLKSRLVPLNRSESLKNDENNLRRFNMQFQHEWRMRSEGNRP